MKGIITKYIGPTNYRGSRIKATDTDGNSITISYDHSLNHDQAYLKAAIALCNKMKWKTNLIGGGIQNGYVFVFANSTPRNDS